MIAWPAHVASMAWQLPSLLGLATSSSLLSGSPASQAVFLSVPHHYLPSMGFAVLPSSPHSLSAWSRALARHLCRELAASHNPAWLVQFYFLWGEASAGC
jgi:hypothetical protein